MGVRVSPSAPQINKKAAAFLDCSFFYALFLPYYLKYYFLPNNNDYGVKNIFIEILSLFDKTVFMDVAIIFILKPYFD